MQFQLLNIEIQSVQVCWICTPFKYNQTQFRRVEVPSLRNHMVHPRLSYPSYEFERTISYSNLTIYKQWNEEKILRKLQMNISIFFNISSKHLKWKQYFCTKTSSNYVLWIWLFGGAAYQGGEEAEAGTGTDEQPGKPPLIRYEETYSTWQ